MQTVEQWWKRVSSDESEMVNWLKNQYHGEITAYHRIKKLKDRYELTDKQSRIIDRIAQDEFNHADWVKGLLDSRGIEAEVLDKESRYWNATNPEDPSLSFEEVCAIAHHAEVMRLERITLLASDDKYQDIAEVFSKIISDETYHAQAFGNLSTPEAIERFRGNHELGKQALGLVA